MRIAGPGRGSTQRIVDDLDNAGLLLKKSVGNQNRYSVNKTHPIFPELKNICIKTFGIGDTVKVAIQAFLPDIDLAFIFGSMVKGSERPDSDVDFLVVGDFDTIDMIAALEDAETRIGRTIHLNHYPRDEWLSLANNHVLNEILKGNKIMVAGNELVVGQ
jgi:predicted nucleotidyltransferase